MLSVQSSNFTITAESASPSSSPGTPAPEARPLSMPMPLPSPRFDVLNAIRPTSELLAAPTSTGREAEVLDEWFENFHKYEALLEDMASASADEKFKDELGTIEQWFKILSHSERTATLYSLLQHASQIQIRFFIALLQQMVKSDANPVPAVDHQRKSKPVPRNFRPPSLSLPSPGVDASLPSALRSATLRASETTAKYSAEPDSMAKSNAQGQDVFLDLPPEDNSWASMVKTPSSPMFLKKSTKEPQRVDTSAAVNQFPGMVHPAMGLPGFPYNLNMLNSMGLSTEAQILAVQIAMSGYGQAAQPAMPEHQATRGLQSQSGPRSQQQQSRPSGSHNWRLPGTGKYPGSTFKSSPLKSGSLKSSGMKSNGLKSASSMGSASTLKEEEFDPELLKDVPAWLKSLRLHKYTACFDSLTWREMVELDDPTLEAKGVAALGARRRLLRTFEMVKTKMGLKSAEPTSKENSTLPNNKA